MLGQTGKVMRNFWPEFPTALEVLTTLGRLYLYDAAMAPWLALAIAALFGLGLHALRNQSRLALSLALLSLLPPVFVLIVSLRTPMFLPRIMLWAPIPFCVVAGAGCAALRARWAIASAGWVLGGGLLLLPRYYEHDAVKAPWRELARTLSNQYDQTTVVFTPNPQERTTLDYYFSRRHEPTPRVPVIAVRASDLDEHLGQARTVWLIDRKRGGGRERARALQAELEQARQAGRGAAARRNVSHAFRARATGRARNTARVESPRWRQRLRQARKGQARA